MQTQEQLLTIPAFLVRDSKNPPKYTGEAKSYQESNTPSSIKAELLVLVPRSTKMWGWLLRDALEDHIDAGTLLNTSFAFDTIKAHKSKSGLITYLKEVFTGAKDEYVQARGDLLEYFEAIDDEAISYRLECYISILADLEAVALNKRARRKTKKGRNITKVVSHVAYRVSDPDLKVESIHPSTIVGAAGLVVYNTKYKRLCYMAALEGGLEVSGTTIKNIDEEKSLSKTLRQPEQQVPRFRSASGVRRINVLLKGIKGKSHPAATRLNNHTLLLKTF